MFIYNPYMYIDDKNKKMVRAAEEMCELIVAKHRNGSTGTINVKWIGGITTFVDVGLNAEEKSLEESIPQRAYKNPNEEVEPIMSEIDETDEDLSEIF